MKISSSGGQELPATNTLKSERDSFSGSNEERAEEDDEKMCIRDSVYREKLGAGHLRHVAQDRAIALANVLRVHHGQHCVDAFTGVVGGLDHVLAELGARLVQARRIDKDDLPVRARGHAQQTRARGLGVVGNDGHLFPHKAVHDAGLAHVGAAEDGHEARAEGLFIFHRCPPARRGVPGRTNGAKAPRGERRQSPARTGRR